jgi:choline kinase
MKALILSAGQGRRLLPLTAYTPKCALVIGEKRLIEWQIDALLDQGVDSVTVVVGYAADQVEQVLANRYDPFRVRAIYNPFYEVADNLMSCWTARDEMIGDFMILNGDTLFEPAVLGRLLNSPVRPVTLAIDRKRSYDADDMKVSLNGNRLIRVGKHLSLDQVDGESIGMMVFRQNGPELFRDAIERAVRKPQALKQWYLSIIDELALSGHVWTQSIEGLQWGELDDLNDLQRTQALTAGWHDHAAQLQLLS